MKKIKENINPNINKKLITIDKLQETQKKYNQLA